jgi:energy-coupling factor transporter ATP-binding protein EcfA2
VSSLEAEEVTFTYKSGEEPALRGVSCAVESGEFVGVTGPTDAGKSTFCRLFSGFVPTFFSGELAGTVGVENVSPEAVGVGTLGETVGVVFENPRDQLTGAATTVLEEVAFGLEQRGVPPDRIETRARAELDRVGVAHLSDRDPNALSGGQLQRVAIASVLVLDPEVLILDEPTSQLDPDGTAAVIDVAREVNREGYTVVLVSHRLQELAPAADRLFVFDDGRLAHAGPPRRVLARDAVRSLVRLPPTVRLGQGLRDRGVVPADHPLPLTAGEAAEEIERFVDGVATRADGATSARTDSGAPSIRLDGVEHVYENGVEALSGVSLEFGGGCVALVGHNGAGKSTLAKHLNGLLEPTAGRVTVGGTDTRDATVAELAADVGLVFQDPDQQLFRSTVAEEVRFGPENVGVADADGAVTDALRRVDLEDLADVDTYELGRPTRKRVALASVLAMETDVLVLDEPTGGQDAAGVAVVGEVVEDLVSEGRLVVCATHDVDFVCNHADHVVALSGGSVVAEGPPAELFAESAAMAETGLRPPVAARVANTLGVAGCLTVEDLLSRLTG